MLEETALVWCLLLPLCFQIDEKIQQMFKKKRERRRSWKMGQTVGLFKGQFVVSNELPRGQL